MPASPRATWPAWRHLAEVTEMHDPDRRAGREHGAGGAHATASSPATARRATPTGEAQELIVIGMGKLGGRELNVSSDIDLIFVYPEDGETDGDGAAPISNFEFFTRLGREPDQRASPKSPATARCSASTCACGPNGDSGPLVCSFDMLENYFITQGREWERYAWIKARPLTRRRAHDELEAIRRPFVFRKYLDFGAINAMRELHAQIRREVARRTWPTTSSSAPAASARSSSSPRCSS